jgi:hypothetical protein
MDDFEEICSVISSYSGPRVTLSEVPKATVDNILRECARRIASDEFFLSVGRRLFSEYMVIRVVSRRIFEWLFNDDGPPAFFV